MLLGFKRQFAPMIRDGSKRHTLRGETRLVRRVGDLCHNYTGLRTKQCELLGRWPCTRIARAEIMIESLGFVVAIDETRLRWDELVMFAHADGFRFVAERRRDGSERIEGDVLAMKSFWMKENGLSKTNPWRGQLIVWNFNTPVNKRGVCERS